jgi:hypothetical protein
MEKEKEEQIHDEISLGERLGVPKLHEELMGTLGDD